MCIFTRVSRSPCGLQAGRLLLFGGPHRLGFPDRRTGSFARRDSSSGTAACSNDTSRYFLLVILFLLHKIYFYMCHQVRVCQGKEPPHLLCLFKSKPLIVYMYHPGSQSLPSTRLFQVRRNLGPITRIAEVMPRPLDQRTTGTLPLNFIGRC